MENIEVTIEYNSLTRTYKVNGGQPVVAWDYANNKNQNDFGFNLVNSQIYMASNYTFVSIYPLNYSYQYNMVINDKKANFIDVLNTSFNKQTVFQFRITYSVAVESQCKDAFGNEVGEFLFGEDGIVYGVLYPTISKSSFSSSVKAIGGSKTPLSPECCSKFNFEYENGNCYWSKPCDAESDVKIMINSDGNNGSLFEMDANDTCTLGIEFDYLLQLDCAKVLANSIYAPNSTSVVDYLSSINVSFILDVINPQNGSGGVIYESNVVSTTIYETDLINLSNFIQYIGSHTPKTGIDLKGDNAFQCGIIKTQVSVAVASAGLTYTDELLESNWLHFKLEITDQSIINQIRNKRIRLGVKLNGEIQDYSILMDNFEINRICTSVDTKEKFIAQCPSFELDRVIDNKKSWVAKEEPVVRDFDLSLRETNYNINHNKLGINSKEVEITLDIARAVENDLMGFVTKNPCVLELDGVSELLTTEISNFNGPIELFNNILNSELIDAKSRQTIRDYPVLKLLYENYMNASECGLVSSQYTYNNMMEFVDMIGNYWVDLIEQVVPSTTIWGSTYKYSNTIFDNNKFKYKKYSLYTCSGQNNYDDIIANNNTNVQIVDLNNNNTQSCNNVYIRQINDGSEFIGSVTVVGGKSISKFERSDVIIINE